MIAGAALVAAMGALLWTLFPARPEIEHISHGRFENVTLYRPAGEVRQFVLFLSGDGGWDADMARLAEELVGQGALVAGIDMTRLVPQLEADGSDCVFPDGDLENFSHFVQAYYHLPDYLAPLLVGYSSGATMSYAMLAQAAPETFAGAITLGFCADLEMKKPLCRGEGVHQQRRPDGGTDLLPAAKLSAPWVVIQGEDDPVCSVDAARLFTVGVPDALWVPLAGINHDYSSADSVRTELRDAARRFAPQASGRDAPGVLADLPLIEVPSSTPGDVFAVLLSGDGGWAGLDKKVAAAMAARGVPVIGFDSLRYFWKARTPQGLAQDLDRVLAEYANRWKRSRVMLIGYSQGADVLPFAVNRLASASRERIAGLVLLAPGQRAAFEFRLSNWVGRSADHPVLPEALQLDPGLTLCVYGKDETDSLCPRIPANHARSLALKGGHHFDGDYLRLAEVALEGAR